MTLPRPLAHWAGVSHLRIVGPDTRTNQMHSLLRFLIGCALICCLTLPAAAQGFLVPPDGGALSGGDPWGTFNRPDSASFDRRTPRPAASTERSEPPPTRPSVSNATINVFFDRNGDGRYQPGEPAIAGVRVAFPAIESNEMQETVTDAQGRSFIGAIARAAVDDIEVRAATLPDPSLDPGTPVWVPDPAGPTDRIDIPVNRAGAIAGRVLLADAAGSSWTRSGVPVRLFEAGRVARQVDVAMTETDGRFRFPRVPPGRYRAWIDVNDVPGQWVATPAVDAAVTADGEGEDSLVIALYPRSVLLRERDRQTAGRALMAPDDAPFAVPADRAAQPLSAAQPGLSRRNPDLMPSPPAPATEATHPEPVAGMTGYRLLAPIEPDVEPLDRMENGMAMRDHMEMGDRSPGAPVIIELGRYDTALARALDWLALKLDHSDTLGGLQLLDHDSPDMPAGGYPLWLGPLQNSAAARAICTRLRADNLTCSVRPSPGTA